MINKERLAETFKHLISINSVSKEEGLLSNEIKKIFENIGAQTFIDDVGKIIGSDTGNLVVKFKGNVNVPAILLNAHMDTVEPGRGIKPIFENGIFKSDGKTILGAYDKSAIAIMIEAISVIIENKIDHGPIELVFTICEELGLLGAKHFDINKLSAKFGYVIDTTDTQGIVTRAPAANKFEFKIYGKAAHAGAVPEKGINAISLASKAIASLTLGRIDHETTCNIGRIEGGIATNIVPDLVTVKGEARSHDEEKLEKITNEILSAFRNVIDDHKKDSDEGLPRLEVDLVNDFRRTFIPDDHPVVKIAKKAAANLDMNMATKRTGGGADANIFFQKGIITGVLGTGMLDMHTVSEFIALDDMVKSAELLIEILKLHAKGIGNI
ncbi:MAG: M20/M25/M40 family metallo-hydrolase [Desulfobacterales bacterium]|nr:M20/M25/M40 family metallo-hydrolase [Desulfobacterales bacterium]